MSGMQAESTKRERHKRIPDHQLKPGADLQYSIDIRSVETFRMERGVFA